VDEESKKRKRVHAWSKTTSPTPSSMSSHDNPPSGVEQSHIISPQIAPGGLVASDSEESPTVSTRPNTSKEARSFGRKVAAYFAHFNLTPLALLASTGVTTYFVSRFLSSNKMLIGLRNGYPTHYPHLQTGEFATMCTVAGFVWLWARAMDRLIVYVVTTI